MPTKSEIIEKLAEAIRKTKLVNGDITLDMAANCLNALSEYVTFLEEGSEPQVGDIVELPHNEIGILDSIEDQNDTGDAFYYDPLYCLKGKTWGNRCFNKIYQRNGKPVITLQKE